MTTIQKFTFPSETSFLLELPDVFRVVRLSVEGGYSPRIWVMFDSKAEKRSRKFESYRDGVEIDSAHAYVGTYAVDLRVFHLFWVRS